MAAALSQSILLHFNSIIHWCLRTTRGNYCDRVWLWLVTGVDVVFLNFLFTKLAATSIDVMLAILEREPSRGRGSYSIEGMIRQHRGSHMCLVIQNSFWGNTKSLVV